MKSHINFPGLAALLAASLVVAPAVQADPWGSAMGGALGGAIIGGLIGGEDGAAAGAAIGGVGGYARGASRENQRRRRVEEQRTRYERERVELERRRLEEERRFREKTASAPSGGGSSALSNLIIETQRSLTVLGYKPGPIDGQPGQSTTTAIEAYQAEQGLLVTGQPSEALLAHMRKRGG